MGRVPPDEVTVAVVEPRPPRSARVLLAPQSPPPLRPDAAATDPAFYRRWRDARDSWRLTVDPAPAPGPELTLLVVVGAEVASGAGVGGGASVAGGAVDAAPAPASPADVRRTLASVAVQTVGSWSLSLTIVGTPDAEMDAAIADVLGTAHTAHGHRTTRASHASRTARASARTAGRVRIRTMPTGTDVATALGAALEESGSPAVAIVEPGDELAPDAVAQLGAALVDADVAYADEDRVDPDGLASSPVLKPDWSPELLLTWSYVGRPVALRVAPLVAAGGIRPLPGGDWEHDLLLRVTERTSRVAHVAAVLCHRCGASSAAVVGRSTAPVGPAAVTAALTRRGEPATVLPGPLPSTWSVRRRSGGHNRRVTVSAIVPFRDSTTLLRACTDALGAGAKGAVDLELVLVDNGSTEPETATLLEGIRARLSRDIDVVVRRDDRPFNWAALNNAAAAGSRGDVLLFVNDDVQGGTSGWMELLVAHALRSDVGAVGARLVYPDGRLQHAGIVLGLAGATGHVLAGLEPDRPGYLGMAVLTRDVSAVTGACMATRREVFDQLGGFDETLGLDFNDVDYCLRARRRGLRVVLEAGAELVHHESPSRGTSGNEETAAAFCANWGAVIDDGDPFYNRHLSRLDFSAALDEPGPVIASALRDREPRTAANYASSSVGLPDLTARSAG